MNYRDQTTQIDTMAVRYLFKKDGYYFESMNHPGMAHALEGRWNFEINDTQIKIIRPSSDTLLYNILKLKEKEMWLKREISGITFEFHLIPAE